MVQSEFFGRTFWLGKDNQLKSAATFIEGGADYDNFDYVNVSIKILQNF